MLILRSIRIYVALLLLGLIPVHANDMRVAHDTTVGPSDHPVPLKAGTTVKVLSIGNGKAVISATLADGSSGIYQIDPGFLEAIPSAVTSSGPLVPPSATSPPAAAATPAPVVAAPAANPLPPPAPTHVVVAQSDLPDDKTTVFHVNWPEKTKLPQPYDDLSATAGDYSYSVYIPPGYNEHPNQRYPALFIMSPDGHASLGNVAARAHDEGWVVVMFVEARNGDWGPIFGDFVSTHADVINRLRIIEGLKIGTGFSGGARATSILTQICPGFGGEILQSAGFAFYDSGAYRTDLVPKDHPYAVYMIDGKKDDNVKEIDKLKDTLHVPFQSATFDGGHDWAPEPLMKPAIDWILQKLFAASDPLPDDWKPFALRHFDYLSDRVLSEPESKDRTAGLQDLVDLGNRLDVDHDPVRKTKFASLKAALPLDSDDAH